MPLLYSPGNKRKKHSLCLVLHEVDASKSTLVHVPKFFYVMNIGNAHVEKFVDELLACGHVVSTSLHGLIAAHAYDIPGRNFVNINLFVYKYISVISRELFIKLILT